MCDNGHTNTKRPRMLGRRYREWGGRRRGGLASVTQSATEHMSWHEGRAGREGRAGAPTRRTGGIPGALRG